MRAAGAAGVTGVVLACGDNALPSPIPGAYDGVAILEPTTDALIVAVWSANSSRARVEVTAGGVALGGTDVILDPETGSAAVDLGGLAADTVYAITVTTDLGVKLGPHLARTAPRADDPRPIRLAVSADQDPSLPEFKSDLLDQLIALAPELYVSIGDFPYTDDGPPAITPAEYRARYAVLRTAPDVRRLHEAVGVRAIYDDHEFRNDWDAQGVAEEPARYAAAVQVWDEFFPLRDAVGDVRYRSWRWGANLECFLLDCRRFRSANAAPDTADKTMLGATQQAWLIAGLAASTATFKLVFTSIPLDFGVGDDHWASFTVARGVLFEAIATARIAGVLFISGDKHWFASHRHEFRLREIQVGPIARGLGTPPPARHGVLFRAVRPNVGVIDIAGDTLTITGLGVGGEHFYSETVTAEDLRPPPPRDL